MSPVERPGGRPHIVLIGLMGAGKSTLAEALADRLGHPVRDSDHDIARLWNTTGADIAERHGVPRLHEIERGLLLGALAGSEPAIVTAAASTVDDRLCRDAMRRRAFVVVLDAPVETLVQRSSTGRHRRAIEPAEFATLAARRAEGFALIADLTLDSRRPVADLVAEVLQERRTRQPDPSDT